MAQRTLESAMGELAYRHWPALQLVAGCTGCGIDYRAPADCRGRVFINA